MGKFKLCKFTKRDEAIKLREEGFSYQQIADKFGIAKSHVWYHLRRAEIPDRVPIEKYSKLLSENRELKKKLSRIKEFVLKQTEVK